MILRSARTLALLLLSSLSWLAAVPAVADFDGCFPFPPQGTEANRDVAVADQGITLFCISTSSLAITETKVRLTFPGLGPMDCARGQASPGLGACGFVTADTNMPADGQDDSLLIFYGGLLPLGSIGVEVVDLGEVGSSATYSETWTFTVTAKNRSPAAVELVFDISSSMRSPTVAGGSVDRLTALQDAAQVFFDLYGDYALAGDRVGAVYFNSSAKVFEPTADGNLKPADEAAELEKVEVGLEEQSASGWTSIGAGLIAAAGESGFGATMARKFVLLFSDGEQNTSPLVVVGDDLEVGGNEYDEQIRVCPITAGRRTAPGFRLQQDIAKKRCEGNYVHVRDAREDFVASDLETFFLQNLSDILVGDKLEMVRDTSGTLRTGQQIDIPFRANSEDILLSLLVSARTPLEAAVDLPFDLVAPDGTLVDLADSTRVGRGMSFTTLRLPVIQGKVVPIAGEWRVRLRGDLPGSNLQGGEVGYHVAILLDNRTLVSEFASEVSDPGTGEPIPLRVTLGEAGQPVGGAEVRARVVGPREGLGEILSQTPVIELPPHSDGNSAVTSQLLRLATAPPRPYALDDRGLGEVRFVEDQPGVYRGVFDGADEEGHYQFVLEVEGDAPHNRQYQRTRRLSVFVRPKPAPSQTDFEVTDVRPFGEGNQFRVTVHATPRDLFRNRIGPGYLGHLLITASDGTVVGPPTDLGNGTYETLLELGPGDDPRLGLEVMGEPIESSVLSDLGRSWPPRGGGGGRWSLHLGLTEPRGRLGALADGDWSLGLDRRFPLTDRLDAEIYLGHDRFDATVGDDLDFTLLTGRLRYELTEGLVRSSVVVGLGPFFDGDDVELGLETALAVEFSLARRLGLELSYSYRDVDRVAYGLAQLGLLFDL